MAFRWVMSPVVSTVVGAKTYRRPLVATLVDRGRPAVLDPETGLMVAKEICHVSFVSGGRPGQENDWCLSLVRGADLSAIDGEAGIESLVYEHEDHPAHLDKTPDDLAWPAAKRTRFLDRLSARGVAPGGAPLWVPLSLLAERLTGHRHDPRQLTLKVRGV